MGRGQLKYRKRGGGGAGRGGDAPGRWSLGRDAASNERALGVSPASARVRRGGRQNTTHLPSNTEKWGRAFDEVRGSATTTATSTAIGFEETERLLDESEWAVGSSAWRLEPREDEQPQLTSLERGEGLMAATNHGLLSLDLEVLASCLRGTPVHERLQLPLKYTAELEGQVPPSPPAQEPLIAARGTPPTSTGRSRSPERRHGGFGVGGVPPRDSVVGAASVTADAAKVSGAEEACRSATAAVVATEEGGVRTTGGRRAGVGAGVRAGVGVRTGASAGVEGRGGGVAAAPTEIDDGVLDALLGLTGADLSVNKGYSVDGAAAAVADTGVNVGGGSIGGYSGVSKTCASNSGSSGSPHRSMAVRGREGDLPSPASAKKNLPISNPQAEPVGGDRDPAGAEGRRDHVGGGKAGSGSAAAGGSGSASDGVGVGVCIGGVGGADELEDWLDDMLADA